MKHAIQVALIIIVALVLALASNAFASRQRKLMLRGYYPDARRVPAKPSSPPPAPVPAPAPVAVSVTPVPTATIAKPAKPKPDNRQPTTDNPKPPQASLDKFQPHPDKAYVEIAYDDVASLYRHGVLFLDARRTSVFEEGHIAGARPFSVWESDVDDKVTALFNERSDPREQNQPIVLYCSGGACEDSHMLSQKLWGVQFNNVYVYKDGFPDWQQRGGAVRKGSQP